MLQFKFEEIQISLKKCDKLAIEQIINIIAMQVQDLSTSLIIIYLIYDIYITDEINLNDSTLDKINSAITPYDRMINNPTTHCHNTFNKIKIKSISKLITIENQKLKYTDEFFSRFNTKSKVLN